MGAGGPPWLATLLHDGRGNLDPIGRVRGVSGYEVNIMFLLFSACSDYQLDPGADGKPTFDPGDTADVTSDTDDDTPPVEDCNGVDDNGDGTIDEGFVDTDGDGVADCVDAVSCDLELPTAGVATDAVTCGSGPVVDPWNVVQRDEWVPDEPTLHYLSEQLATGNFNDDNGDGVIDTDDISDIVILETEDVCVSDRTYLVVLNGADLSPLWEVVYPYLDFHTAPAVGDIDGDGSVDVVVHTDMSNTVAFDIDGNVKWASEALMHYNLPGASLADLDGDGTVEVLMSKAVFEGATGATRMVVSETYGYAAVAANLDQSGAAELLYDGYQFDPDGEMVGDSPVHGEYQAVWDLDGDPATGEVIWAVGTTLAPVDASGRPAWTATATGAFGPPTVADLDGDGAAEVVATNEGGTVTAWDKGGDVRWTARIDFDGRPGIAAGDLDNDGDYELVLAGAEHLYILDGDGSAVWTSPAYPWRSTPVFPSYPVLSDLDGDGSAEISHVISMVQGGQYFSELLVWSHADGAWPKMADSWDQFSLAPGDRGSDGSVPTSPTPSWVDEELFRGWPSEASGLPDLRATIVDICAESCDPDGGVGVSAQVSNVGDRTAPAGTPVTLYREDGAVLTAIATVPLPTALAAGATSDAVVFDLVVADLGLTGLVVAVDDDGAGFGAVDECVEDDNTASYADLPCR